MSLSIKLYTKVEWQTNHPDENTSWEHFYNMPDAPDLSQNMEKEGYYSYTMRQNIWNAPATLYDKFRRELARLTGIKEYKKFNEYVRPQDAFYELFNFGDNEGCIDTAHCALLYEDFEIWDFKVEKSQVKGFKEWYDTMKEAFHQASQFKGVIKFH